MMASIQGYPVRASLHAASNSSSSSQGIYSGMQNLVINDETIWSMELKEPCHVWQLKREP